VTAPLAVPTRPSPVQGRARATQDRIVAAAAAILAERGADGFTMTEVADRAAVAIGSVYRWFPAQSALISELAHRHLAAGRVAALDAVRGGGDALERLERALRTYLSAAADPLVVEIMRCIREDCWPRPSAYRPNAPRRSAW
jgi:AcrR family transcriptional regulator